MNLPGSIKRRVKVIVARHGVTEQHAMILVGLYQNDLDIDRLLRKREAEESAKKKEGGA